VDGFLKVCPNNKIDAYIAENLISSLSFITYITWKMDFYNEDNDSIYWLNLFKVIFYESFLFVLYLKKDFFFQVFDAEFTSDILEYVRFEI
jgi:hypothetical protein